MLQSMAFGTLFPCPSVKILMQLGKLVNILNLFFLSLYIGQNMTILFNIKPSISNLQNHNLFCDED